MRLLIRSIRRWWSEHLSAKSVVRQECVQPLERRQLLTAIVVNALGDATTVSGGQISLRAAIAEANTSTTPTTITFDPTDFSYAETILLSNGVLTLDNPAHSIAIVGPSSGVVISGNFNSGVLDNVNTTTTLSNLTVSDGIGVETTSDDREGGGIDNSGNLTLTNVNLTDNSADFGGGLLNYGTANLTDVTIACNNANFEGGGIYNDGTANLTNVTIARNTAAAVAGMTAYGTGSLNDVTISGNTATNTVGGISDILTPGHTTTIANTIIAGNSAPSYSDIQISEINSNTSVDSLGGNFIGQIDPISTGWLSTDKIGTVTNPINPMLSPLASNGGYTQTMFPLPGSPVIDAGSNTLIPAGVTTDQCGRSRILNGTVDIGAVEAVTNTIVVNSLLDSPTVSGGSVSLRAAIAEANASTIPTDITFTPIYGYPETIVLTNGVLTLDNPNEPITIIAPAGGVVISGNHQSGVFYDDYTTASLSNLTVTNGTGFNAASGYPPLYEGGGIYEDTGDLTLTNVTITGNSANSGGGLYNVDGGLNLTDVTISNNTAQSDGGLACDGGISYLTNVTISGNTSASFNGGFANVTIGNDSNITTATLNDVTISNNSAATGNGGLGEDGYIPANLVIANSIIAGNTAPANPDIQVIFETTAVDSLGHNLIGIVGNSTGWLSSDITGTAASPVNALLGPLGNHAGYTPTMVPQPGSPAINAGSDALLPAGITTDQRGLPRISSGTVDIGAVEVLTNIVVNSTGDAPAVAGASVSLRAAIAAANLNDTLTTITFDPTVFATLQTITLTNGTLNVGLAPGTFADSTNLIQISVVGPSEGVIINGNNHSTVLTNNGAALSLSNLTITGGTTSAGLYGNAGGGGIFNEVNSTLSLDDVTITKNTGDYNGGGIYNEGGYVTILDSTLSYNTAENGGGIYTESAQTIFGNAGTNVLPVTGLALTNTTIAQNTAPGGFGGGIYDQQSLITLADTTISQNYSGTEGGIVFYIPTIGSKILTLSNTIIAGNGQSATNSQGLEDIWGNGNVNSLGYNLIGDSGYVGISPAGWLSTDLLGTPAAPLNPHLGPLANNGGPTQTLLPQAGTLAFNGGSNALIPPGVTSDQRGLPRIYGGTVDIGAVELQSTPTMPQLTGNVIGTPGSWNGTETIYQAFDGNLNTYYDPANGNLTNWVGLDLGKNSTITQISYAPRTGYEFRMLDGQFQVSSTPDFSSDVHTIYTITTQPTAGQLTTVDVNPGAGYRYIRYTGGLQWVNIAEMEVFGIQLPPPLTTTAFTGTPIGVGGAWVPSSGYTAAFDGNLNTYFDPANGNLSDWAGLDMGQPERVTQISYAPRAGYEFRMVGGEFQVSSTPNFSSDVHTLYTLTQAPVAGHFTTITFPSIGAYRYIRYTGGDQWVNIAELKVAGEVPPIPLTGTAIGVGGAWVPSSGYSAAFDGNTSTYFDPANGNLTNWVGLDLGSAKTITQISYVARAGYEFRMVGAQIQVSDTPDFSSDVQTIYTITSAPATGQVVTVSVSPMTARYIRYIGGTQWVNIAELEVDGI